MSKTEIKDRLRGIIREMLLTNFEANLPVPPEIRSYILKNYNWTSPDHQDASDEMTTFIKNLQMFIETKYNVDPPTEEETTDLDCVLYKKMIEVESEYCLVSSQLVKVLQEAIDNKEKYSQIFKDKCKSQSASFDVLLAKCRFLKLQFFAKLYGEKNALANHLALRSRLKKEVEALKKEYKTVVELNEQYDSLKNNKNYWELFQTYKQLKEVEEKTSLMVKINAD